MDHQVGGDSPAGYHAVNLALHLIAVALLFRALGRLIPPRAAFVGAAIFAVHPFAAEPVNYIFERSTVLETIFCLAALLAWTRRRFWPATLWFAAALLSKEECVAFPLFLVMLDWVRPREPGQPRRDYRRTAAIAAMLALATAAGVRALIAGHTTRGSGVGSQAGISALHYFLTEGPVILRYLRLLILPWGFTVDPAIPISTGALAYAAWAAVFALAGLASRRFSRLREGFWFLAGLVLLLPSSSIFPAADFAADRRMYLPLIAFSAALGLAASAIRPRAAVIAGISLLAALSLQRTLVWRTEESLWTDAVAKAPLKIRPKIQLARAAGGERGLAILAEAKSIAPDDPKVASEEGRIALSLSNPQLALVAFGRALALEPSSANAHSNRGVALLMLGQPEAARGDFERALAIDPCQFDARLNLLRLGTASPVPSACAFSFEQKQALRDH